MIKYLESIYASTAVKQVNKHTYQGIDTGFTENGTVEVSMIGYIDEALGELTEDITTPVKSPVAGYLFKINNSKKHLSEERAIMFHRLVKNMLFVRKNTRPYIHPTI